MIQFGGSTLTNEELVVKSNASGIISKRDYDVEEFYRLQNTPEYTKNKAYEVKRYRGKRYTKKDGTVIQYYNYKLKAGRRIKRDEEFIIKKMLCAAKVSEGDSPKSGAKLDRRIYAIHTAKNCKIEQLNYLLTQIVFKIKNYGFDVDPWEKEDKECQGSVNTTEQFVHVQITFNGRRYSFRADLEKADNTFNVTNQTPLNDKSVIVSRENNIEGVYSADY